MNNKSPLMARVSDFVDSKFLKINNVATFAQQLDADFDLIEENGKESVVRKQTGQVVGSLDDNFMKTVLRPHINDRSFGSFRSAFPARETTAEEKSKVYALLQATPTVFKQKDKQAKLETFVMNNFIPSGDKLHRIADGYISTNAWTPDEIIQHYAAQYVDADLTTYSRLKKEAELREEARYLAPTEESFNRVHDIVQRVKSTRFEEIPPQHFAKQNEDLEKKSCAHLGILDKRTATLAEINAIEIKKKTLISYIDTLPVINLDE